MVTGNISRQWWIFFLGMRPLTRTVNAQPLTLPSPRSVALRATAGRGKAFQRFFLPADNAAPFASCFTCA